MIAREEVFHKATMEDLQPEVTIIVPIYHAGQPIGETCESLLAQKNVRWEALFIDAGERRVESEIVKSYHDKRLRVQLLTKASLYALINRGVLIAEGEYVNILLEGCTFLSPNSLATILQTIKKQNSPDLFYTASYVGNQLYFAKEWQQNLASGMQPAFLHSCFIKNSLFKKMGLFNPAFERRGALDFFCRILAHKDVSVAEELRVYVEMNKVPTRLLQSWLIFKETGQVIYRYGGLRALLGWAFSKRTRGLFQTQYPLELIVQNASRIHASRIHASRCL